MRWRESRSEEKTNPSTPVAEDHCRSISLLLSLSLCRTAFKGSCRVTKKRRKCEMLSQQLSRSYDILELAFGREQAGGREQRGVIWLREPDIPHRSPPSGEMRRPRPSSFPCCSIRTFVMHVVAMQGYGRKYSRKKKALKSLGHDVTEAVRII